jgi:hypothetical protein
MREKDPPYLPIVILIIISIDLLILTVISHRIVVQNAFAGSSPSFQRQEVTVGSGNWFDMLFEKSTSSGPNFIDIRSVSYFSNGTHLNATFWLANFTIIPNDFETVN